jgi:hypothetical protein
VAEAVVAASPVPVLVHRAYGIEEAVARYEAAMVVMAMVCLRGYGSRGKR